MFHRSIRESKRDCHARLQHFFHPAETVLWSDQKKDRIKLSDKLCYKIISLSIIVIQITQS